MYLNIFLYLGINFFITYLFIFQNKQKASERRLKNTFGWARIDILVMLVGCVMFASFCFSLIIEAFQTIFHISHKDEMHYPIPVFCVGAFGLVLNGFCYLLIGGDCTKLKDIEYVFVSTGFLERFFFF